MAPPHEKENLTDEDRAQRRALNTPDNAVKAVAAARECIRFLTPGKVWTKRTPKGDFEIKGTLMLEETAVAALHFSPEDGSVLPKGLHSLGKGKPEILAIVQTLLADVIKEIEALDGAEFREPESFWAVPLVYRTRIVGHLKVAADGSEVVPDKKVIEE
jgi:hypothetical protein